MYGKAIVHVIALVLLVAGGLNWGVIGLAKFNPVRWLSTHTVGGLERVVYIAVGLAALTQLFRRDYYLPFLGKTAYPCGALAEKTPTDTDVAITVEVAPNTNVVYWAAEPSNRIVENPWLAYQVNANAGVVRSDDRGMATLRVRRPAAYKVPSGRTVPPHIHYRTCKHHSMLSRVKTVYVSDGGY